MATSARKRMPIVFCASLVPCESENRLPVMIWPSRKLRETVLGRCRADDAVDEQDPDAGDDEREHGRDQRRDRSPCRRSRCR